MIYNENTKKLEDTLEVYNTYLISNATVKFVAIKFRSVDYDWQWTIDASTLIQTFNESLSHEKLLNIEFIPFEQFGQYADRKATIDILAAVAQVHTPKVFNKPGNPKAHEIIINNQEYIANKEKVEQLCDRFLAKSIIRIVPKPEDKDITPITDVPNTPETVSGKGNVLDPRKELYLWTKTSGTWLAATTEKPSVQERKFYLIASSATTKKVKFEVLLTDASGSMTATMFENHAEEYFLVNGKTLMNYAAEKDQNVVAIFPKLAIENEYRIQLKPREYPSHGVKVLAYNINSIKPGFSEQSSKEDQATNTRNSALPETKAKKKLFQVDDNPTTT
ncbi:hypothetical protein RHGRI_031040 [Rhododendron griersonianum]|uniref:Uncharacterized protein n=1 Tax=Rhododendron griersonianum TaxID=479676 RepID=A0AAV6IAZ0_9ERIC|nr:hypothetical protein RHGRI_031040 [Rhododendron griersonianum]